MGISYSHPSQVVQVELILPILQGVYMFTILQLQVNVIDYNLDGGQLEPASVN